MKNLDFPQLIGASYTLGSMAAESQKTVNMYIERIETDQGKSRYWLKPTPGLLEFADLEVAPVRRLYYASNGRAFAIGGNTVFEVFIDGTKAVLGILASAAGRIRMVDNGQVLVIVYGTSIYTYIFASSTFSVYVDADYLGGSFIGFINQFFLVNVPNTQAFQASPLAWDGVATWDASDIFAVESSPDNVTAFEINGREIWFFGPNSYEVFFNSDDGDVPFQRIIDAAGNIGTIAPDSVLAFAGRVFWLGSAKEGQGLIFASRGYQPEIISDSGVEAILATIQVKDDAKAWSYLLNGHYVYCLNFPSAARTINYDTMTQKWFETEYRVPTTNARIQHRAHTQMFAFNKNLVGDFANGKIYELSATTYTDNGDAIIRYRRSANQFKGSRAVTYNKLQLDVEVGLGLPSGQGSDPQIMLRWSKDLGKTWSNYRRKSLGRQGQYNKKVTFNKLGGGEDRIWEITVSDPIPFRIFGAELGVEVGVH